MKKLTAILLALALLLSLAACAPVQSGDDTTDPDADDSVPAATPDPVPDPAETYTTEESSAEGVYESTGIYFFGVETVKDVSHRIIGEDELDSPIGEMQFTTMDELTVTYRIHADSMINADQAANLFGTRQWTGRDSVHISNNVTTLNYNVGGDAILYWYDTIEGLNCCAHFSTCEDMENVVLYANLLYAFVHSEITPEYSEEVVLHPVQ